MMVKGILGDEVILRQDQKVLLCHGTGIPVGDCQFII